MLTTKKVLKIGAAAVGAGAAALGATMVIRAAKFKPKDNWEASGRNVELDEEKIVKDMQEMIRCKTISYKNPELIEEAEFEKFRNLLMELYPNVHGECSRQLIGKTGILYRWKGKEELYKRFEYMSYLISQTMEMLDCLAGHNDDDGGLLINKEQRKRLWIRTILTAPIRPLF